MKHFLIILLLTCVTFSALGQLVPGPQFGIYTGWKQYIFLDQLGSPNVYEANAVSLDGYLKKSGKLDFELLANLQLGNNQPQQIGVRKVIFEGVPDFNGDPEIVEARLNPFVSWFSFRVSGDLSKKIRPSQHLGISLTGEHLISGIAADDWYYTQIDLAPTYQYSYEIWQFALTGKFKLPLLAWVVRPNYAIDPSLPDTENYWVGFVKTSSAFTSLNRLVNPQLAFELMWNRPGKASIGVTYEFAWRSYTHPRALRMATNELQLNFQLKKRNKTS